MKSGKLLATNDELIKEFLNDENYKILDTGEILTCISKQGHKTDAWRTKGLTNKNGYLSINYKKRELKVHRIIYAAFIGNLKIDLVINHIDGNPSNNLLSNLELVTQSENNINRFTRTAPVAGFAKINQVIADEIRRQVAEENMKACHLARRYNLAKSTISMLLSNKIWKIL